MLSIKWIGQAGYILSDGVNTVCIDPYLSDVVNRIAGKPRSYPAPITAQELKADVVICTHNHLDHVDIDAIPLMDKNITFFAPTDCKNKLLELGVTKYQTFDQGDKKQIGKFTLNAVYAKHTVDAIGVVIEYGGQKLFFTGDTLYDEKLKDIKCDILFICINGKLGNMNVLEAVEISKAINPITAIPNHYDMFESNSENPKNFTDKINNGFIMQLNKEYKVDKGCLI